MKRLGNESFEHYQNRVANRSAEHNGSVYIHKPYFTRGMPRGSYYSSSGKNNWIEVIVWICVFSLIMAYYFIG